MNKGVNTRSTKQQPQNIVVSILQLLQMRLIVPMSYGQFTYIAIYKHLEVGNVYNCCSKIQLKYDHNTEIGLTICLVLGTIVCKH